jgi:polysaccharide deacetylase 2 family uncharacterized protein YibQ
MKISLTILTVLFILSCSSTAKIRTERCGFFQSERKKKEKPQKESASNLLPRIAIIIDDIGTEESFANLEELLLVPESVTFAILPGSSHSKFFSELLLTQPREIILHLPLEPHDSSLMDADNFLLLNMGEDETVRILERILDSVKGISGVNTHMGSRYTQDSHRMELVLKEIQQRNLYFIDSRTDPASKAEETAKKIGVKTMHRDCFIDNIKNEEEILKSLDFLLETAKNNNGKALGIGHPFMETARAIRIWSKNDLKDFVIVPVSELVGK